MFYFSFQNLLFLFSYVWHMLVQIVKNWLDTLFLKPNHVKPAVFSFCANRPEFIYFAYYYTNSCPTPAVASKIITAPVKRVSDTVKSIEMQAFKFDGSRTVRIICQIDICKNKCNPVVEHCSLHWNKLKMSVNNVLWQTQCNIGGSNQESWGRKKRTPVDPIVVGGFSHFQSNVDTHDNFTCIELVSYDSKPVKWAKLFFQTKPISIAYRNIVPQ